MFNLSDKSELYNMNNREMGGSRAVMMAIIAVIGAVALIAMADLVPGIWKILAWLAVGSTLVLAVVFYNKDKVIQKTVEKKKQSQLRERNKRRKDQKQKQEQKIEKTRENLEQKEEKLAEKRAKIKENIIEEATATWTGREDYAKQQETTIRKSIDKTDHMPIRMAAGEVAVEWNEATALAQWTMQQVGMFSQLPDAQMTARIDAQDAIIESIKVKEGGGQWTFEKGKELAEKKEKARLETKTEEDRIDNMRSTLDNADLKWKATERRISRLMDELNKHVASYKRLRM